MLAYVLNKMVADCMPKLIIFKVGEECFEITRCLLSLYPCSLLAKKAYEQWLSCPDEPICIDRDPCLFRYVLTYLREKKVTLPISIEKCTFISELEYYCIGVDECAIDTCYIEGIVKVQSLHYGYNALHKAVDCLHEEALDLVKKANSLLVAKQCIAKFLESKGKCRTVVICCFEDLYEPKKWYTGQANEQLKKVGLKVTRPCPDEYKFIVTELEICKPHCCE